MPEAFFGSHGKNFVFQRALVVLASEILEPLNRALLARQFWRILLYPNSLKPKVLKIRYFPSCSIMKSKLGCNPSFMWRNQQN
ncbi:reverse transcriptase [Melia azedarach]|uniref:Reverse transcriptase n=1 Tax=Melia azedarach TaxID=155640 RepID=A0ACC1WPH8_MELAZ|nr:reverse transcriptase [Melia azedarach]